MKVRLFMVLVGNLLTLTGCASTAPLEWLRESHAVAIAEDLVIAVAERVPPSEGAVYVAEMPLRDYFEAAIRAHGYAIAVAPDNAIEITGLGERVPPNTWHVGLAIDGGIRIHRLYRIEQSDVHALSAISVLEHVPDAASAESDHSAWHMRSLTQATSPEPVRAVAHIENSSPQRPTSNDRSLSTPSVEMAVPVNPPILDIPAAAPVAVSSDEVSCLNAAGVALTFQIGSLKQGIVDALSRCDWRVVDWPTDSTNERVVVDWIVTRETTVHVASIEELLAGLRAAYGLEATIDEDTREISFWIDES